MNSKTKLFLITITALCLINLLLFFFFKPSATKVVYIDTTILMTKYKKIIDVKQKLNDESAEWQTNIQTLEKELTELNTQMVEQGASWSKDKLAETQKKIEKKQEDYYRYRRAIEEKTSKREQELLQPVIDEINIMIEDYGKAKHYDMILGTLSGGNVLYGNKSCDVTDEFLDYANSLINK